MTERERSDIETSEDNSLSIRSVFEIVIYNWYWFAISITACLVVGYLFYKTQPPIFSAKAVVMIKLDNNEGSIPSEAAIFNDLGFGSQVNIIENEIHILRSTSLLNKVVDKLGLDVVYNNKSFFRDLDLYNISPINVTLPNKELFIDCEIDVEILDDSRYKYAIYDVKLKEDVVKWSEGKFDEKEITSRGEFIINTTDFYNEELNGKDYIIRINSKKHTINNILKTLSITKPDKKSGVLSLTVNNKSFLCAKQILDTLISVYNAYVINDKNRISMSTEKFILNRLNSLSINLSDIDGEMEQLKKDNNIIDLASSSGMMLEKGAKYQEAVISIETEINFINFIKEYLLDSNNEDDLIPSISISDIGIGSQIEAYNKELLYLKKIIKDAGKNNPVTLELSKRLNVTKINVVNSIDNTIFALDIKLKQAKIQEDVANRRIENVPTQEKAINVIAREQKIKEELYLYLLNKREENALTLAITESHARIIEDGDGTGLPLSPNLIMIIVFSLILGVSIPAIILYIIEILDTKLRTKLQVEEKCSIPILGLIPNWNKYKDFVEITEESRDPMSEAYRIIRSNMGFLLNAKNKANVIQLTSTMPGEGKTSAIINIALSFAHIGKKVLLIDLDIRKGKLSTNINSGYQKGISNYLSGKTDDIDQIIQKGIKGTTNLDFIPTGSIPPNPTSLLLSYKFTEIIEKLKDKYDYIFLDSVPAMVVADSSIIDKVTDANIYVIRSGMVDKRHLREIESLHTNHKLNNMSILMTGICEEKSGYGYGYGYEYGKN